MILCAPSARGCFNKHYCNEAKLLMMHINAPATHQLTTYSSTCKYLLHPACSLYSQHSSQTYTVSNLHNHSPLVSFKKTRDEERKRHAGFFVHVGYGCWVSLPEPSNSCNFHSLWRSEALLLSARPTFRKSPNRSLTHMSLLFPYF